ncbi:hypothetical protein CK507_00645 [Pseudomonas sp. WN033]|nr:hypothetical protein CK507_00645 [Pseudomonas sp. WN033]
MTKTVFISYSHDSDEHKKWVRHLATNLVNSGVQVILDQWDLRAGEEIPRFVEESILGSDRVLLICTEQYARKANQRSGGVGLEAFVINSSLMSDLGTTKFIVLVRQGSDSPALPELLKSRLYLDFSRVESFNSEMDRLIKEIHDVAHLDKPELGPNPFEAHQWDSEEENNTKLDLARAYMDMGDSGGASDILTEVMSDGSLIQQKEARRLLSKIKVK